MGDGSSERRRAVLRFKNSELVLGPRMLWVVAIAAVIVWIGIAASPQNIWTGIGVGVAGVLGAALGSFFQITPIPRDWTPEATSAVRGLVYLTRDVENVQTVAASLAVLSDEEERVRLGLLDIHERLVELNAGLYTSMSEWEAIAPRAIDEYQRIRGAGRKALERLTKEIEDEQ